MGRVTPGGIDRRADVERRSRWTASRGLAPRDVRLKPGLTIDQVLKQHLEERRSRLLARTVRNYQWVIELL